jgi:predicted extracellular nuclease
MKISMIIVFLLGVMFILFSIGKTYAYLSSIFLIKGNTITVSSQNHIVINEVSPNGGKDQDWIELFNPTNQNMDLTGWKIHDNATNPEFFSISETISAGGYAVIVASGSAIVVPDGVTKIITTSTSIGNGLNPDGDYIKLLKPDNSAVDQMSYGSDKSIFNIATPSAEQTIQRIPNGQDTDTANDWKLSKPTLGGVNQ